MLLDKVLVRASPFCFINVLRMNILKQIYEIYEYLFYRTYIWQLRLWGEKRSPEVAGLLLPTSLFTFVFVGPIVGVLHSLEVQNNEELGILLAVIFTFAAHRLFVSDGFRPICLPIAFQ